MHLAPHLAEMLAQRQWDAVLVDQAIGADAMARLATIVAARRIVLITPGERHRLPALKDAGFAGYLVKPIRAASLKAQLVAAPVFDSPAAVEPEASSAFEQAIAPARANRWTSWSPRTTRSTRC
jgi:AmiR/NasT family two-component response regulator